MVTECLKRLVEIRVEEHELPFALRAPTEPAAVGFFLIPGKHEMAATQDDGEVSIHFS